MCKLERPRGVFSLIPIVRTEFFLLVLAASLCEGCNGGGDGGLANDFLVSVRTTDKFNQPSISFIQGDQINMTLTITNISSGTRTLSFPSSKQYDFVIQDNTATEVWRWSDGKSFTTSNTSYDLAPGNVQTFTYQWDQTLTVGGALIPVGSYTLKAEDFGFNATATQPLLIF